MIATAVTALAGFVVTAITAWAVTVRLQALRARYAPHPERATFEADFNPTDANIASRVQCATTRPAEAVTSHGQ